MTSISPSGVFAVGYDAADFGVVAWGVGVVGGVVGVGMGVRG